MGLEWDELARRVHAMPYLRPAWVEAWWSAFGAGKLELLTFRRDRRLAAVLPVMRRFGTLRSATNCHTPRSGILAEDADAAAALAQNLFLEHPNRVSIESLCSAACIGACRRAAESAGYRVQLRTRQRAPYLEVSGAWTEFESGLSRNLRTDLSRCGRRLRKLGPVSMEAAAGAQDLDLLLGEAFHVEAAGWKGENGTAIRSRPDTLAFYTDIARWAAAEGVLRLFFLRLGNQAIAVYFALEEHGVCHLLKGGFDQNYARYSPAKLLMHSILARAWALGLSRVEFHGDQEPYKLNWTRTIEERDLFEAFSRSPVGQVAWAAEAWGRPAARRFLTLAGLRRPVAGPVTSHPGEASQTA